MAYDEAEGRMILSGETAEDLGTVATWALLLEASPTATIASPAYHQAYAEGAKVPTTFRCEDAGEGTGIESCVDSNGATGGTGTLDTSTSGAHTYIVAATSEDRASAVETIRYEVVAPPVPDGNAESDSKPPAPARIHPAVRISNRPGGRTRGAGHGEPRYPFRFADQAPGVTIWCSLDGAAYTACASPRVHRYLKKGRHVFRVYSVAPTGRGRRPGRSTSAPPPEGGKARTAETRPGRGRGEVLL
jgi:hypothetical protein